MEVKQAIIAALPYLQVLLRHCLSGLLREAQCFGCHVSLFFMCALISSFYSRILMEK